MHRSLLVCALFALGCHISLNDPGTEPPVRQFYFPTGIAFDSVNRGGHTDEYLWVSNGNSDLRYGGGLIQLVDARRFECAVARWCETMSCAGYPDPATIAKTEQDLACDLALADQDLAYKPSKNEAECQLDPLDPSIVDCDETPFIVGNASQRVGNFAGTIRVLDTTPSPNPSTLADRRLFIGVRGDPSITWLDAHLDSTHLPEPCADGMCDPKPGVTSCQTDPASLLSRSGYDAAKNVVVHAPGCDADHIMSSWACTPLRSTTCPQKVGNLPTEPFGMRLDHGKLANGDPYSRLLIASLDQGQVTLIDHAGDKPVVADVSQSFFPADPTGRHGAFDLAPQRPGDPTSPWYMTSSLQPQLATFRVADVNLVVPSITVSIGGAFAIGTDIRAIEFEPGGNRAFLTENDPPTVVVLDTRPAATPNPGQPANQLVDIVDVCQTPSHMGVRRGLVQGAPGTPAYLATNLYVVCFLSNLVMVVDPDAPGVLDTIIMGRGPNDIAFNFGSDGSLTAPPDPPARRAYVTQFSEMSIGVLDLEPGSPTYDRMIARIGKPVPPPKMNQTTIY